MPWEITAGSSHVEFQNDLSAEEYAALISDNVEDLTELRLWSLEKIKENKAKVTRVKKKKSSQRSFRLETWFGRQYYHWVLKIENMVNGLQIGTGRTRLIKSYPGMRICWRSWMASSSLWRSTASISRNTFRACGMENNKSRCGTSGYI